MQAKVGLRTETVEWHPKLVGPLEWLPKGPRSAPVARGQLDTGMQAEVFVEIGDPSAAASAITPGMAKIAFTCWLPTTFELRDRLRAERHLQENARLVWCHHPDTLGLVAAAQARVRARVAIEDEALRKELLRQSQEAGRRWVALNQQLSHPPEAFAPPTSAPSPPARPAAPEETFDWAPNRKPNSSFVFYRLTDGLALVVYTMADETVAIAPWPKEDGWDEAPPASVGLPMRPSGSTAAEGWWR